MSPETTNVSWTCSLSIVRESFLMMRMPTYNKGRSILACLAILTASATPLVALAP